MHTLKDTRPAAVPPRPRPCPVCRSAMIAQDAVASLFRCDDCGCTVDLRGWAGDAARG
ncbi:MAG: hypothetical protein ACWA6X_08135 [Bauldia sp.]